MIIIDELQRSLQLAVIVYPDKDLARMWPAVWARYANQRFDRQGEASRRQDQFERAVYEACKELRTIAERAGCRLDFDVVRLRYLAIKSLEHPCPYCGELYGVDGFSIVRDQPTERGQSQSHGIRNVVVCCRLCGEAKGPMSSSEFLEVKDALRGARPGIGRDASVAMALGRKAMGKRKAKRYFPAPPGCG
jgi:hypothetical protein